MSATDVLTLLGAFAVIILMLALTYYATRWYARRMSGSFGMGRHIKVLDRVQVSAGASLSIVEVSSRYYLISVGDKGARLICELPDFDPSDGGPTLTNPSFGQTLREMMQKVRSHKDSGDDGGAK